MTPEAKARQQINQKLEQAGWVIQDMKQLNLSAGTGIAVREYPTDTGPADYVLFVKRVLVASPGYIARHGQPARPEDLRAHNALLFANPAPMDSWSFIDPEGKEHWVRVQGNFETNNCDALREAILAGLCIALRPAWDVWRDLRQGKMIALLPNYTHPSFPIQALYPSRRHLSQKVRLFIDLLRERFGDTLYWEREDAADSR